MDIQYGKPAESVKRFSRFKWMTAAILLALLLLTWFTGALRAPDSPTEVPGSGADAGTPSVPGSAPPSFAIDVAGDGKLTVQGTVADEVTRNQWLNAIRIGAQGTPVVDELKIGSVSPAAGWVEHLSGLVAVLRERKLGGLRVDGDKVFLKGAVGSQADKAGIEKMIQARLPSGYRLDSQLAVSALLAGSSRASPGSSTAPGAAAPPGASASTPSSPSSSSASSSSPSSASSSASPSASPSAPSSTSTPDSGAASALADADAGKTARDGAGSQDATRASKTAVRRPANCPRRIQTLAKSIYFKTDAANISSADHARLERLGECLGRAKVRIVGHADPRHTDEYNLELSERRARTVADALAAGGAPSSRISIVAAGKTKPTAKGASRQALQRSRRVDIQIR